MKSQVIMCVVAASMMSVVQASVESARLEAFKAAGVVDEDTIVYLPLDDGEPSNGMQLDNYAFGSRAKEATLFIDKGSVACEGESIPGDGGKIRGGYLATREAEDRGCLHFQTNAVAQRSGSILIADADRAATGGSFTFEAFMRWRESPSGISYVLAEHGKSGNLLLYMNTDGKLALQVASGTWNETDQTVDDLVTKRLTAGNVVDDRWHHVAVTVDREKSQTAYYVDYQQVGTVEAVPAVQQPHGSYNENLMIGTGYSPGHFYQMNNGYVDNVRMTGRVLDRSEFLCVEKIVDDQDTLAWISFEGGDLGVWPYPWSRKPTSQTGTYAISGETVGGEALKASGVTVRKGNTNSLCVTSSTGIRWTDQYFCGKSWEALTIEFFAKGTDCTPYAGLVNLYGTSASLPDKVNAGVAAVEGSNNGKNFRACIAQATASENNALTIGNPTDPTSPPVATDGVWHHVAVVFQNEGDYVRIAGYYGYKQVVSELTKQKGHLRDNLTEATLWLSNALTGNVDEIRVTRRALAPREFLRRQSLGGSLLIIR